jgi:hypothetical protein
MGQLDIATQQNAASSEELAATSEELSRQAELLQKSVAFFSSVDGMKREEKQGNYNGDELKKVTVHRDDDYDDEYENF